MKTDHILVAIDLGGASTEVVMAAAALAAPLNARVTLFTVVSPGASVNPFGESGGKRVSDILEADASTDLEPFVALMERDGISVTKVVGHGEPGRAIRGAIAEHQPGFVVMGSHGRTGWVRTLFGSVTDGIIEEGGVPVLVVRSAATGLDPSE